jgi:hypothetical protein
MYRGKQYKKSSHPKVDAEIPIAQVGYHGPILKRSDRENTDTATAVLVYDVSATAAGTALNPTFSFYNPNITTDWTEFAASYDLYRVLGVELHYVPNADTANFANSYAPIATVVDRDTSTALSTYAGADNYGSLEFHVLDRPWSRQWHMETTAESQFFNTSSPPSSSGAFKTFASGLSNVAYGRFICYWRVQFMGRGI